MPTLAIPPDEQAQLSALARSTKDAKTAIRIRVILALAGGQSAKHVADMSNWGIVCRITRLHSSVTVSIPAIMCMLPRLGLRKGQR
jgi:hypothetical protein